MDASLDGLYHAEVAMDPVAVAPGETTTATVELWRGGGPSDDAYESKTVTVTLGNESVTEPHDVKRMRSDETDPARVQPRGGPQRWRRP